MNAIKFIRSKSADFIIRITSVRDATWQGRVEHIPSGQVRNFSSFLELFNSIHYKLEAIGFPQPATELRCWDDSALPYVRGGTELEQNQKNVPTGGNTFMLRIQFRQNTTWQGTVQWLDKKKTAPFRSLLELIMLVNEAMAEGGMAEAVQPWNQKEDVS